MKKRIFFVSLLTTIFMLMFFSSAFAQRPVVYPVELHAVYSVDCTGFQAEVDELITGKVTTFSDENGNPNEFVAHLNFVGTITHSKTGQSLRSHGSINFRGDLPLDDKAEDRHGVFYHLHVPGKGVVTLAVGRIVTDDDGNAIFTAGQNGERLNEQGVKIVCEGLAGL